MMTSVGTEVRRTTSSGSSRPDPAGSGVFGKIAYRVDPNVLPTIDPRGEPQTTLLWYLWEGGVVRFSLVEGRQKLRNLRRDPCLSVVVVDPADPTW